MDDICDFECWQGRVGLCKVLGDFGEAMTASTLRSIQGMQIIRSLYVPYSDKTVQIDLVGVSEKGVFVIENKNFHGRLSGDVEGYYWTLRGSMRVYNPIKQNEKHCLALREVLGSSCDIYSVVMFNDNCELVLRGVHNCFLLKDFKDWYENIVVDRYHNKGVRDAIVSVLESYQDMSDDAIERHIRQLGGNYIGAY